jgi:hypothetical protein
MTAFEEYVKFCGLTISWFTRLSGDASSDHEVIWYRCPANSFYELCGLWCSCEEVACAHRLEVRDRALSDLAKELRQQQGVKEGPIDLPLALSTIADWLEAGRYVGQPDHHPPYLRDFLRLVGLPNTDDGICQLLEAFDELDHSGRWFDYDLDHRGNWEVVDLVRAPV